jgi:hypothetical protein
MSPAETAYRNARYDLFGIEARWVRKNGTSKRIPLSAQSGRSEALWAHCNLQLPLEGDLAETKANSYHDGWMN